MSRTLTIDLHQPSPTAASLTFDPSGQCRSISIILNKATLTTSRWVSLLNAMIGNAVIGHSSTRLDGAYVLSTWCTSSNGTPDTSILLFTRVEQALDSDALLTVNRDPAGNVDVYLSLPLSGGRYKMLHLVFDQYGGLDLVESSEIPADR